MLGVILVVLGFSLQSGATGAVKAVKMSSKLVAGNAHAGPGPSVVAGSPSGNVGP